MTDAIAPLSGESRRPAIETPAGLTLHRPDHYTSVHDDAALPSRGLQPARSYISGMWQNPARSYTMFPPSGNAEWMTLFRYGTGVSPA